MQLNDVWEDICRVAAALEVPERGRYTVKRAQQHMSLIADKTAAVVDRPHIACIEWLDPLMAAGNWVPEMVEMAGGINLFGETGKHSPWMTFEELKQADIIIIMPCGFDIDRSIKEMPALTSHEGWQHLKAVQNNRVYITDGNQYFNRPGPRLVESLEILAEIIHPELFDYGHQGSGWRLLS
jgi:iron complex transport system substrate-binding protein